MDTVSSPLRLHLPKCGLIDQPTTATHPTATATQALRIPMLGRSLESVPLANVKLPFVMLTFYVGNKCKTPLDLPTTPISATKTTTPSLPMPTIPVHAITLPMRS